MSPWSRFTRATARQKPRARRSGVRPAASSRSQVANVDSRASSTPRAYLGENRHMAPSAVEKRVAELRQRLEKANYEYHVLDQPTISDESYDALIRELREIEAKHPELVTPESPTQRVGAAPSSRFAPVEHARPMLSLSNVFDEAELRAFDQRVRKGLGRDDVGYVCE